MSEPIPEPIVLGPWRAVGNSWERVVVHEAPLMSRYRMSVRGSAARDGADVAARKGGAILLDAEPGRLSGCSVRRVEVWPGRLVDYRRAPNTPAIGGVLLCDPDELYRPGAWNGHGWYVQDLEGIRIAHGPETDAEGERLLLAALRALGVEVVQ